MKTSLLSTLLFGALLALAGCGGGTGGTGGGGSTPPTATNGVSIGVMTKGSVIVNGVHFDDSAASIRIDDTPGKLAADLKSGMVVKVRGEINDDRVTGTAQQVAVRSEVRGTVQTKSPNALPPSFTVINQTVVVDDLTIFANFSSPTIAPSLAVNELVPSTSVVEVHGLRDTAGNIHASRVEIVTAPVAGSDELKGTISSLTATTFVLNGVTVNYSGATVTPGATLANGQPVEVHGSFNAGTFNATQVHREDLEDAQFEHASGEEFEVEGQVSGCAVNPCTSFSVGTQAVQTNASTRFENGSVADLSNNVRVEVEGHQFTGPTLIAEKIQFNRARVILTGAVAAVTGTIVNGTGNTGTITVLGKTVQVTTLTEVKTNNSIIVGERVEVRGYVDSSDAIVAERVDDNPGGNATRVILQARVTVKNGNVLTLLGINADLAGASQFFDTNEVAITQAAFLAAVTAAPAPGGTLVKVQGTFSAGTIAVEEAELEN